VSVFLLSVAALICGLFSFTGFRGYINIGREVHYGWRGSRYRRRRWRRRAYLALGIAMLLGAGSCLIAIAHLLLARP
jgi:hypothetical protein